MAASRRHAYSREMPSILRETWLGSVFVALADADAPGAAATQALHQLALAARSIDGVAEAGILLVDDRGSLEVMASSSARADMLAMLQLADGQGPCVDCYRTGEVVHIADLPATGDRWPVFARSARILDVRGVLAVPLRLRGETIGAMNLFSTEVDALSHHAVASAQALADVATMGILQSRTTGQHGIVQARLQAALESRVLIEQAKGVISGSRAITVDDAFRVLREHARSHNQRLHDTARLVVDRRLVL